MSVLDWIRTIAVGAVVAFGSIAPAHGEKGHRLRTRVERVTAAAVVQDTWKFWPQIDHGAHFPGGSSGGSAPADPSVAVGPTDVVQVLNSEVRFFNKAGVLDFQQSAAAFFAPVAQTALPFSPKAFYDGVSGRYFLLFMEVDAGAAQLSNVLLAVSDDSDPHGSWFLYRIDSKTTFGATQAWMDYSSIGHNDDGLVVTGNRYAFADGAPGGTGFLVFPKTPLLTGAAVTVGKQVDTTRSFVQLAEDGGSGSSFVYGATRTSDTSLRLYGVRDPGGAAPVIFFVDKAIASSPAPPSTVLSTGGKPIETNATTAIAAAYFGNRLSVAFNTLASGLAAVRYLQFDTSTFTAGTAAATDVATVSSPTTNYFMPTVRTNVHGDLALMFTACSESVTSDLMVAGKLRGDPVGSFSAPVKVAEAAGSAYSQLKWGLNFSIGVDGTDGEAFWGTSMVVGADDLWATVVERWHVSRTWPLSPTGASWARGFVQSGGLASLASDDGDYYAAKAGPVLFPGEPPAQLVVDAVAPEGQVLGFDFSVVAKVNTVGLTQRVELWNWLTSAWVSVGQQAATLGDSLQSVSASGALGDYVQSGTGKVRAKVSWFQSGPVLLWPWQTSVDQVEWRIRTRQ